MSTEFAKIISLCVLSNYLSFDKNTEIVDSLNDYITHMLKLALTLVCYFLIN